MYGLLVSSAQALYCPHVPSGLRPSVAGGTCSNLDILLQAELQLDEAISEVEYAILDSSCFVIVMNTYTLW